MSRTDSQNHPRIRANRRFKGALNRMPETDSRVELGSKNAGCIVTNLDRHPDRCVDVLYDGLCLKVREASVEENELNVAGTGKHSLNYGILTTYGSLVLGVVFRKAGGCK